MTKTSLQTGTTPDPISANALDFSGSDDEILDNFADGPNPNDDGTPMGLGGEKGIQSEPASTTLEADIVNGTKSGEALPPESAGGQPVQPTGEEGSEKTPEPTEDEPDTPEFPPMLLQMAGLADAEAAQKAGFKDPEALHAAIKWRGQALAIQPAQPSGEGLYRRPAQQPAPPPAPTPETTPEDEPKPFELPNLDTFDEDFATVIRQMNDHYQSALARQRQETASLRDSLSKREAEAARQQEQDESMQFDEIVQGLDQWKDVFGEGTGTALAHQGQSDPAAMTAFNHRTFLFEAVQAVRDVNAKQGYKPMSLEQEVHWALMQRYPDKFQQVISGKTSNGSRPGVTASRPTQRRTPPKGKDATVASVDAMLRKRHGYALDMGHPEEEFDGDI